MTHSIISLGQRAALSALLLRASCPGMDSSSGFNMYREPAYLLVLSITDQHTGLLNMLRSPIFALGSLGVGNRPAAGLHRTIGISAIPSSLWPGCELQKYRTIELFCFQGARGRILCPAADAAWEIVPSLGSRRKWSFCTLKLKVLQKISNFNNSLTNVLVSNAISFR